MANPVTGPFTKSDLRYGPPSSNGTRYPWYRYSKTWRKQHKPYNLCLPFSLDVRSVTRYAGSDSANMINLDNTWVSNETSSGWGGVMPIAAVQSYNKAYKDFIGNLKPAQAELGSVLAEHRSSLEMIAKRSLQLAKFTTALKRLRFGDAAAALGLEGPKRKFVPKHKAFASAVLEYSFGWAPLVSDVSNALSTLTAGLPAFIVRGRGKVKDSFRSSWVTKGVPNVTSSDFVVWESRHSIRARVRAINPNTALANQLGLVNLATPIWEVTPWSFVVDYFVNVGEWLNGFMDLYGYTLADTSWTWTGRATNSHSDSWDTWPGYANWDCERFQLVRDVGPISGPQLAFRAPWRLSPKRAATSVSLLLQRLR